MEDRKFVCPCYRHEEDIARDGHCICHLFVNDTYVPEEAPSPPVVAGDSDWPDIVVYGAAWCRHTLGTRQFLTRQGIPYRYIDVEQDEDAASKVRAWNGGYLSTPTLVINGRVVTEPSTDELGAILGLV